MPKKSRKAAKRRRGRRKKGKDDDVIDAEVEVRLMTHCPKCVYGY